MVAISSKTPSRKSARIIVADHESAEVVHSPSAPSRESQSTLATVNGTLAELGRIVAVEDNSVGALIEQLAVHDGSFKCVAVTDRSPVVVEPSRLRIGDDNLLLTDEGWDRLAKHCGASSTYWAQFNQSFRSEIAQYHFDHDQAFSPKSLRGGREAIAVNDQFLGLRQSNLVHLDYTSVVQAVIEGLGTDAQYFTVNRLMLTAESIFVELKTSRRTRAVKVGDVVQGGIAVSHSLLGTTPTSIELYVHRVVCANGMALRHCVGHAAISRSRRLRKRDNHSVADAMSQVERLTQERMSHLDALLMSLCTLPEARLERSAANTDEESMRRFLMPTLRATHLWSNDLWNRLLAPAWRHEHGGNGELHEFAAVNTITYVATHQHDLSFRQRQTLARLAGLLAFRQVHVCPRCHNAVVSS